jgi:hypothetical protein
MVEVPYWATYYRAEMARTIDHRGYRIHSSPVQLTEVGYWTVSIHISWEENGIRIIRSISSKNAYPTQEEADVHGIAYGQRIIHLKIPGVSLVSQLWSSDCWTELLLSSGDLSIAKREVGARFHKEVSIVSVRKGR